MQKKGQNMVEHSFIVVRSCRILEPIVLPGQHLAPTRVQSTLQSEENVLHYFTHISKPLLHSKITWNIGHYLRKHAVKGWFNKICPCQLNLEAN